MSARTAVGGEIRRLRQAAGLRPAGLALAAGLSPATIWALETGMCRPTPTMLRSTAEALATWSPRGEPADVVFSSLVELAGSDMASDPAPNSGEARRHARRAKRRQLLYAWLDERARRG